MKRYTGNNMVGVAGWICLGRVYDREDRVWIVCKKLEKYGAAGQAVKVSVAGMAPRKGNYWLIWSGKRLSGFDFALMRENRPVLLKALRALLRAAKDES